MSDPRHASQPGLANRLSEDIGDVLSSIRRLIAQDEALLAARDRAQRPRSDAVARLIEAPRVENDDLAGGLARRHGGNAALARDGERLLYRHPRRETDAVQADDDIGRSAEARPHPLDRDGPITKPQNDLARRMTGGGAGNGDAGQQGDYPLAPLRLVRRQDSDRAEVPAVSFAEDHDWKARMRPDPVGVIAAADPRPAPLTPDAQGEPEPAQAAMTQPQLAEAAPANPAEVLSGEEQSIRELLREMIREELFGELGQRFSSNLRTVIRREVAAAIDDQLERF